MLEKQAEDFRKMRSGDMKAFERIRDCVILPTITLIMKC